MKYTKMLLTVLLMQSVFAKLAITLTSVGQNAITVSILGTNNIVHNTIKKDLNLSAWVKVSTEEAGQYIYRIEDRCIYKNRDHKPWVCIQGMLNKRLGHIMADIIFKDITGKTSWFSSKLAMVSSDMRGYKNRQYRLEVTDSVGEDTHIVFASPAPIMSPTWSPDGQFLAYVSFENGKASLWKQNLQSGSRVRLTNAPGINGAPAWSPDQKFLAFVLIHEGTPTIHVMNLHTNTTKAITVGNSIDTEPCWHPNGRSFFYTSSRGGQPQIFQWDLTAQQSKRVTFFGDYNATPSISKDGQRLSTLTRKDGRLMIVIHELAKNTHQILSAKGSEEQPMIHDGGEIVVFGLRNGARMQVAMSQVELTSKYQLPSDQGWTRFASWSPSINH